jgi:hypothetical protein
MRALGNKLVFAPPSPPQLVFELGSGVAGFRVVLLWSKMRGVNNLTERVSVGRLVGCKYLRGREKKNTLLAEYVRGRLLNTLPTEDILVVDERLGVGFHEIKAW